MVGESPISVYDHSLGLMLVLNKLDSNWALERELESRNNGNRGIASKLLLLVIISLLIFVSFKMINFWRI